MVNISLLKPCPFPVWTRPACLVRRSFCGIGTSPLLSALQKLISFSLVLNLNHSTTLYVVETSLAETHYYLHILSASVAPWECPTIIAILVGTNMIVKHRHSIIQVIIQMIVKHHHSIIQVIIQMIVKHRHSMAIQMIECTQIHST